jgi:hypothetical protein
VQVDSRLQVTKVSATKGSRVQNADPQNVEWLVPVVDVGESVDIVIDFSVLGTALPAPNVSNTGKISGVYTDDNGRRAIIEEKDTDSIDVVEMTSVPTMSCPPVTCPPVTCPPVDDISCAPSAAPVSSSPSTSPTPAPSEAPISPPIDYPFTAIQVFNFDSFINNWELLGEDLIVVQNFPSFTTL